MRKKVKIFSIILVLVLISCGNSKKVSKNDLAIIKWHLKDNFNAKDKEKLKYWIEKNCFSHQKNTRVQKRFFNKG
jgi:hypothetical protein